MSDDIINDSGADSATSTESPSDQLATSQADTQTSDATVASASPAEAATSGGTGSESSSPTDTRVAQDAQTAPAQQQAAVDYKKRYDELKGQYDRTVPQLRQYQERLRQFDGVDPNAVAQWREAQQRAQAEKLPRYAPQHPDHAGFQALRQKLDWARATIAKAPPDKREEVKALVAQNFTEQEFAEIDQWEQYQREFTAHFAADPRGVIAREAQIVARQMVEQVLQEREAHQSVGSWFQNQANAELAQRYGAEAQRMMVEEGMSWSRAREWMEMRARLDTLSNAAGKAVGLQAVAGAQTQQRKAAAAISADPKADRAVDPKAVAKERGIIVGSTQYLALLDDLNSKGLLPRV